MKIYFLIVFLFIPLCYSQSIETVEMGEGMPQKIKQTGAIDKAGPFYPVSKGMIILDIRKLNDPDGNKFYNIRSKWLFKESTKWKTVNIKELEPFGLKEGMTFKYIEWGEKAVKQYSLKKQVHLAMIGNDFYGDVANEPFYRTFYIVLNDSTEGLNHPGSPNGDKVTGISYVGNEFTLKPSNEINGWKGLNNFPQLQPEKNVDLVNYYKSILKTKTTPESILITDLSFDTTKLYYLAPKSKNGSAYGTNDKIILKISNGDFKDLNMLENNSPYNDVRFSNFIEGVDITILRGYPSGNHTCYDLFILKDKKESKYNLVCDLGGD